ncbi:sacsin N-terminal ATP-binding-like domain-containing protein [Xanthomarina gelatinilytica]|uniref:sacsin N-terminal ATP-binding-like domain-containing protein n=1 Tax=Xanthomarina gelatinilytica TaxID=1137281 RepID=UPI003AA7C17D
MSYKDNIQNLINERLAYYSNNPKEIARDYTIENSIKEEYDGRQLLEMLQNVDDTQSKKAMIDWRKSDKTLLIANYGEAFSFEGIESLMRSHSSPKTKENYIGNKGLGFRSLLTWAKQIHIYANDCKISFSEEIAATVFNEKLNLNSQQREDVYTQAKISKGLIPFPVLAIPKLETYKREDDWQTVIEIEYKEDVEEKIASVIHQISEELLLFLNHIEEIDLVKDGVKSVFKSIKLIKQDWIEIAINEKVWRVFTNEGEIPKKPNDKKEEDIKKYKLKVAFQNDLSDSYYKLFNFFPTKISVSLPCIIHGTFDLNASRDYLNPTDNNSYICKQLATFLGECALRLTTEDVSWKPYTLIKPINSSSDSSLVAQLYKDLKEIRFSEEILPTINDTYTDSRNYKHYSNDFNHFFKTNFPKTLPLLLLPRVDSETNYFTINHYDNDILVEKIDALSNNGINIHQRAELIYQLINCGRTTYKKERFSLLINNEENKAVIDKNTVAFTPMVQSTNKFVIPDSVKIDFINTELYQLLSNKLNDRFDSKNQISREFQNAVKEVVNVQPYDSNSIIIRIVNGVNKALDTEHDILEKHRLIKDMVSALFRNFKHLNNQLEKLELPISLISKSGQVVSANSLFLGSTYPDGETIEWLYDGIYSNEHFLKGVNYWNLQDENIDEVERFFIWLGINKYAKIATKNLEEQWHESHYFNFIFEQQSPLAPINFKLDRLIKDTKVYFIENMEDVLKMDETRQLIILLKDDLLKSQIEQQEVKYIWRYVQSSYTLVSSISYLKYQFLKNGHFSSYVLEDGNEQLQSLINQEVKIDLDKLKSYNFHTSEITNILIKLGAKQNIDFLKPTVLYNALLKTATHFTTSKSRGVQGIYKRIVDALEFQDSINEIKQEEIPKDLELFAKKEGKTVLLPASQVFYSNNSVLPEKIEKTIPVLDFPKRGGQDKVHRFLGVQIIDVSKIKIIEVEEHTKLDNSFQNLFEQLKAPILLYRLYSKSLPKEVTTREAISQNIAYIKNCTIQLVKSCTYNYSNTSEVTLDDFEFVIFNNIFYLKAPKYLELSDLIKASQFSDAFAEIMSIQFNVTELKNDFRFLIRNDLKDTLHLITKDFDTEKLEKVKNYFGIPAAEDNFWRNIYQIKKLSYPEHIIKQSELIAQINTDLDIELRTDYLKFDFDECSNTETYNVLLFLCTHLNLTLKEIYPKGIASYHFEKMRNLRESKESKIKKIIWKYLDKNPKEQYKFLEYLDTFKLAALQSFYKDNDKYKTVINYEEYFNNFIENQLPIKVEDNIDEVIQIENQYQYFSNSYVFDIDDLKDEVKSLFYFTGNEVKIKEYLNENYSDVNQETVENSNNNNTVSEALDIIDGTLEKKKKQSSSNSLASKGKRKKRLVVSSNANNLKNLSGKIAEEKAYASYKKQYGKDKVKWVSKYSSTPDNNDNLQYDIKYEDENGVWRYVEVKSLSYDDSFVLTQAEKKYGIENNSLYEFALVNNQSIYRIANPYTFDAGDTFEENESFTAEVKDYQIHFKIKTV